jgi:hypothetical protein
MVICEPKNRFLIVTPNQRNDRGFYTAAANHTDCDQNRKCAYKHGFSPKNKLCNQKPNNNMDRNSQLLTLSELSTVAELVEKAKSMEHDLTSNLESETQPPTGIAGR